LSRSFLDTVDESLPTTGNEVAKERVVAAKFINRAAEQAASELNTPKKNLHP
jgi:recombinational DNA repair ATPase RecF